MTSVKPTLAVSLKLVLPLIKKMSLPVDTTTVDKVRFFIAMTRNENVNGFLISDSGLVLLEFLKPILCLSSFAC